MGKQRRFFAEEAWKDEQLKGQSGDLLGEEGSHKGPSWTFTQLGLKEKNL